MERTCSWGIMMIFCILLGLPIAAIIQKKKGVSFWRAIFQGTSIVFVVLLVIGLILSAFGWM
jgi:hypothetical protein